MARRKPSYSPAYHKVEGVYERIHPINPRRVRPTLHLFDEGGDRQAMNWSGIGDELVYHWLRAMHLTGATRTEARGVGIARCLVVLVIDEAAVRASAERHGIKVAG